MTALNPHLTDEERIAAVIVAVHQSLASTTQTLQAQTLQDESQWRFSNRWWGPPVRNARPRPERLRR
ncbi:MAG: hypothetical protein ACYDHP_05315 [Ferrimicrobium sp.]